jgi:glycosyltransferase involved in cell wall biosynthesis
LPFSFTAHAKDIYTSDPRQLREKIERAQFVVTCTQYNQKFLRQIAPHTNTPIDCVYHGIDLTLFGDSHSRHTPAAPFKLLSVARMAPKKGLPSVYQALKHLRDRGIDVRHTLIGDGEDRADIISWIKQLGLEGVTQLLGTQPHDVVLRHYREADVFVLGCRVAPNGDRDGIPNVFMESMAMGVPIVATRLSGIPELIQDGHSGLLVPPEAPRQMAQAIHRLLTDPALRHKMITAGRQRVQADFDNQQLIMKLAHLYATHIPALRQGAFAAAMRSSGHPDQGPLDPKAWSQGDRPFTGRSPCKQ